VEEKLWSRFSRKSMRVLVHVRLRHYCLLLRHPAKLY